MNVLYVARLIEYPPLGGPYLRVYSILHALSRRADIFLYSLIPEDEAGGAPAREVFGRLCRDVEFIRPKPLSAPALSMRGIAQRWARSVGRVAEAWVRIVRLVRNHRIDVIWLGYGNISYYLVPLRYVTGKPVVVDTDSVWSRFLLRGLPFECRPWKKLGIWTSGLWKRGEEILGTKIADATAAVSEVDAEYYRRLTPSSRRVFLLPNVIDVDRYADERPVPPDLRKPYICLTGSMSRPMLDAATWLLNEVMPGLWARRPDLRVYIVGRGAPQALSGNVDPRVILPGAVPSVIPYLRHAEAAVVPLRFESGTRFKILEAFACRTPVVSTTLGAEGLSVEDGRHLYLADRPEDFACGIERFLGNGSDRKAIVDRGYDLVKSKYDLSVAVECVDRILNHVHRRQR